VKNQYSIGKTNFFFSTLPFNPWAVSATWLHVGAPQKMNLIPVFNKNSPRTHTELELDVLGVHRNMVKHIVHLSKRKKIEKNKFSSHKVPKQQSANFWFQGILGVNPQIIS
jgi:hypothetical protein